MNPLNDPDPRHQARTFSAQLGELSALQPATSQLPQPQQPPGYPIPTRLSAVLAHIAARSRAKEEVADKMKAKEFMAPP